MKWTIERNIYGVSSERERTDRYTSDDGRFKVYSQPKFMDGIRHGRYSRVFVGREYLVEDKEYKQGKVDFSSLNYAKEWCLFQTGERRHRQDFPYRFVVVGEDAPTPVWLKMLLKHRVQWIDWRLEVVPGQGGPRTLVWLFHDADAVAFRMHFPTATYEKRRTG